MPGMSGREFLERLRSDRPELVARLLFSTGDRHAPDTAALIEQSGAPTVTKPFDFAELERVVRQVAAAAGRPPRASAGAGRPVRLLPPQPPSAPEARPGAARPHPA